MLTVQLYDDAPDNRYLVEDNGRTLACYKWQDDVWVRVGYFIAANPPETLSNKEMAAIKFTGWVPPGMVLGTS